MSDSSYGSVMVEGVVYIDEREIAKRDAEIERLREGERAADAEIERLREENSTFSDSLAAKADRIDRLGETVARQVAEIERLRGHVELLLEGDGKAQAEIERLRGELAEYTAAVQKRDAEIERLRVYVSGARCPHCDELRLELGEARGEIERLRAYKTEIEHWIDLGERMIEPAAQWGPGGNVMVQSSTMFKLGAWWADRPWRVREALGE